MGFISYSLQYYEKELKQLETMPTTTETIYKAKQLLKMLDDLADEGYLELNECLEEKFQGVSRLQKFLKAQGEKPFPMCRKEVSESQVFYGESDMELTSAIDELLDNAGSCTGAEHRLDRENEFFLQELRCFCDWIGYEEKTAYLFLLRDTLLPYVYYKAKGRKRIYPWLLGRKTLEQLTGKGGVDDELRAAIIRALEEEKCADFEEFCECVLPDMQFVLEQHPELESVLQTMLAGIKEQRIVVVESGCSGTFPMVLRCLDERVDVRMYTTYPYLLEVYSNRIFTPKYEENRMFETLYSQDLYLQYSGLLDGRFYVKKCRNAMVEENAFAEVKRMLQ